MCRFKFIFKISGLIFSRHANIIFKICMYLYRVRSYCLTNTDYCLSFLNIKFYQLNRIFSYCSRLGDDCSDSLALPINFAICQRRLHWRNHWKLTQHTLPRTTYFAHVVLCQNFQNTGYLHCLFVIQQIDNSASNRTPK